MNSRDLDKVAALFKYLDIVVMQEVLDEETLNFLLHRKTDPYWKGCWINSQSQKPRFPFIKNDPRGEGYAFLWNTRRIELPKENEKEIYPYQYEKNCYAEDGISLKRLPGYGRFRLKYRPVEIRVINVHIVSEASKNNVVAGIELGNEKRQRMREFKTIAGKLYNGIDKDVLQEKKTAIYTIIIGDYNLNLEGFGTDASVTMPPMLFYNRYAQCTDVVKSDNIIMKTIQTDSTTINGNHDGFANNYDHCSYNELTTGHVIANCHRLSCVDNLNHKEIEEYYKTISDHFPIVVDLKC